jgi:hypothetical protein
VIKELASKFIAPYEAEILAAVVFGLVVFCMWEVHHQRQIGAAQVIAADAAARADEHAKVVKEEARLQAVADAAERERDATVKQLQDYATAHPVGSVRLCGRPGHKPAGVPPTGGTQPGTAGTGTGPAAVPEVLAGDTGPDVGRDVESLLRAAETLGGLYKSTQQVTHAHP